MGLRNDTDKPTLEMAVQRAFAWSEGRLEVVVTAVRRLAARGMTVNEIADALGTTQEDVRDVIEGRRKMIAKAEERPAQDWNRGRLEAQRGAVLGLFALGMNLDEVAETLSSTREEVRAVLEDFRRLMPFGTTWG